MKWIYFSLLLVFCNLYQSKAQLVLGVEGGYGYLRILEKQYFNPNGYTYDYGLKVGYRNAKNVEFYVSPKLMSLGLRSTYFTGYYLNERASTISINLGIDKYAGAKKHFVYGGGVGFVNFMQIVQKLIDDGKTSIFKTYLTDEYALNVFLNIGYSTNIAQSNFRFNASLKSYLEANINIFEKYSNASPYIRAIPTLGISYIFKPKETPTN